MPHSSAKDQDLASAIIALTTLPSRWVGAPPEHIAEDTAAALHHLCDEVEFVQVRLELPPTRILTVRRPHDEAGAEADEDGLRIVHAENEVVLPIGRFGRHGRIVLVARPGVDLAHARLLGAIAASEVEAACRTLDLERDIAQAHAKVAGLGKLGALGQLVGGVAHEIRTPLTYAHNNLYLIGRDIARSYPDAAEAVAPKLAEVTSALDRIEAIVAQLRRFAKQEVATRLEGDLRDLVRDAIRLWRATHAGAAEVCERLHPTPPVLVDRGQLQQVVLNLVQNAHEAAGPDGRIEVRTSEEEDGALLVVEDDGPGMTPEVRNLLFQAFHTTKADGMGLGLSIVRGIVEAHHGSIFIDSEPGRGTRVCVRIPRGEGA